MPATPNSTRLRAMAAISRSRCSGSSMSSPKISWLMARALFTARVMWPACCIRATSYESRITCSI